MTYYSQPRPGPFLPLEVAEHIVKLVGQGQSHYTTLKSCALTCSGLLYCSRVCLYKVVTTQSRHAFSLFIESVSSHPALGGLVGKLEVVIHEPPDSNGRPFVPFVHPALTNVRTLSCTQLLLGSCYPPWYSLLITRYPIRELELIECDISVSRLLPLLWGLPDLHTLRLASGSGSPQIFSGTQHVSEITRLERLLGLKVAQGHEISQLKVLDLDSVYCSMDPFLPAGALGNVVTNLIVRPARGYWLTMPLADTFWDFISELPQLQAVAVEAFADPSNIDELLLRLIQSIAVHARDAFRTLSVSRVLRRRYAYMESRFTPSQESTIVTALGWAALVRELEQFPNFEGLHTALGVDWFFGGGSGIQFDGWDDLDAGWNDLRDKYPRLKLSYPLSNTSSHSINATEDIALVGLRKHDGAQIVNQTGILPSTPEVIYFRTQDGTEGVPFLLGLTPIVYVRLGNVDHCAEINTQQHKAHISKANLIVHFVGCEPYNLRIFERPPSQRRETFGMSYMSLADAVIHAVATAIDKRTPVHRGRRIDPRDLVLFKLHRVGEYLWMPEMKIYHM